MTVETKSGTRLDTYDRFVEFVGKVCVTNPGQRSALRRGLGRPPEQAITVHATVARWLPERPSPATEWAYYAVASMIALQPSGGRNGSTDDDQETEQTGEQTAPEASTPGNPRRRASLGTAMALAVFRTDSQQRAIGQETAEKRLHLLTRQDLFGVHQRLPGVVRHLQTLGVPIDWAQLLNDLGEWTPHRRDQIAKRWLQDFYRSLPENEKE
ncbi:hypothetical protein GCM10027290_65840 [Micromonospora sonneratiae]|uniref:Type I-E CRISPR-associated protein Cse2/CasB n=1 Tax=Micromonospora sonneratiae TaxID=1184706 RepID=A0ABW3YLL1_9ACTN